MKKTLSLTSILLIFSIALKAQEYKTAAGIRLGPNSPAITSGFTVRHFLDENHAIEGILGINDGIGFCGLYQWHHPVETVPHLNWFLGAGGYAAFRNDEAFIGAAGMVGVDYKFEQIPLNLSIDWKPELNFIESVGFEAAGVGFSARFTF